MKINLFLLFIVTISLNFYGQTIKESSEEWKIGAKYSIDFNLSSKTIPSSPNIGYALEFNKFNYTAGISVERKIANRFSILSGLEYSNKDFTGIFYCYVCDFIRAPLPQTYRLRFAQIPVNIKFEYNIDSFSLFAISGMTNSYVLKKQLNENSYLLSGNIGFGLGYRMQENWLFELSSEYNTSFTTLYSEASYNQKQTGIILGIKKGL